MLYVAVTRRGKVTRLICAVSSDRTHQRKLRCETTTQSSNCEHEAFKPVAIVDVPTAHLAARRGARNYRDNKLNALLVLRTQQSSIKN
jgi:hypothetical protein